MLFLDCFFSTFLGGFLTAVLLVLYLYFQFCYSYWKKRGVPYINPTFPVGNIGNASFFRKQMGLVLADIYTQLEGHKFGGFYQVHRPTLMLRDPDLIKTLLVKDFDYFHDRGINFDEKIDPLSSNLFFNEGHKWKTMRAKMTPVFTSGKVKMMFRTIQECGFALETCVETLAALGEEIEIRDVIARYATDVIATCAFGIQCNCLQHPDSEFRKIGRDFFSRGFFGKLGFILNFLIPSVASALNLRNVPKHVTDFFLGVVRETVAYREKNGVYRDDFMQLMIQLKNQGYVDGDVDGQRDADNGLVNHLTVDEIAGQAFGFFIAGFETASTTMTYCLYELAVNQDIQTRLRGEMRAVLAQHGGKATYDAVKSMPYLDMVISDTLRLYPVIPQLNRVCTKMSRLDDTGLVVEPGVIVVVPVYAIHHDPQYYPEPKRFDPERFTPEMKTRRNPYTYLPFGAGPRYCIGIRFAMMQMKVALISLLMSYEFGVSEKTTIPLIIDTQLFGIMPKGGVYLKIVKTNCD